MPIEEEVICRTEEGIMEAAVVLCFANLKTDRIIHSSMWRMVKNVGIQGAITELAL